MIQKLNSYWWFFTILSFLFAYFNPYFGLFSLVVIIILFFDMVSFIILKGHYNSFKKKITDKVHNTNVVKKIFYKELLMFKIMKLFTTFCTVYLFLVIIIQNIESQKVLAPFYISAIQKNFSLQILCIALAIASIIFSFILFWSYSDSYKKKLNELE